MATSLSRDLKNAAKNNAEHILRLHPKHRQLFSTFVKMCENSGQPIWIFSSFRTLEEQRILCAKRAANPNLPKAATPGYSLHNYGLAIDVYVYDFENKVFRKNREQYKKISQIAKSLGLRWLGDIMGGEQHHFDYKAYNSADLFKLYKNKEFDDLGFVLLDKIGQYNTEPKKVITQLYQTELGGDLIIEEETEIEETISEFKGFDIKTDKMKANGIWQIIKLVADQYSLSQTINDATIAHNQGSLFNYIQNVVQEPWLQFFGDTIDNKFFFFSRKEPYDYKGMAKLPISRRIKAEHVLSEELEWYDGPIFSWYQIIPRGAFLGEQNQIFAYISAVFFEEYADIWGSKPNSQVSNYINFGKTSGKATLFDKAVEDLRYLVESNAYLPFTRQGTITIKGSTNIKRGYLVDYLPTNERFYVDGISQRYNITENGPEFTTVLKVNRGMKIDYTIAPDDATTKSYFNIINFDETGKGSFNEGERSISWKVNRDVFQFFLNRKQNA